MSSSKKKERENLKSKRGAEEGSLYQKVALLLLAEKGYELSKRDNSEIRDFAIGREISIGKDAKLDDVVFSYTDQHERKNFIFLQIKHKQDDDLIDSQVLSTAAKNVRGSEGNLCRDFNLKKYFISYLSVRDELNTTKLVELKGGKIKYVALFTNIALDCKELNEKGFNLKEAPDDVVNLLTLKKSTSETIHSYQLGNVSDDLRKILKKSSDLDRLAGELAKYVVWEDYRENKIIGIDETPIKHYHFGLGKYVIKKSDKIKRISIENQTENKQYCDAHFREAFLDCDETATNLYPLRNALFEAIRDLDQSKKDVEDDALKRVLKAVKLKTVPAFGKSKQNIKPDLPRKWIPVYDKDITEFLQHLVFIVEQPRVAELEMIYKSSIQLIVVEDTSLQQFLDTIYDTGPEFRKCVEKVFEMDAKKRKRKQQWISDQEIKTFIEEKKQLVSRASVIRAMTLMYKNEVMQCGKFNDFGKILEKVKNFLTSDCKILCVNTPGTLLSSIKISQALNEEEKYPISLSLNILNSIENRDCVLKAFELESTSLLTIECRHAFKNHIRFLYELVDRTKRNSDKKIILIMQIKNCDIFREHFKNEGLCVIENDSIELKDFEPKEDPLAKKVLMFQGQKERVSLSDITGIDSWPSYGHSLSQGTHEQGVIDEMTLEEILIDEKIIVGSKPAGASSLEGAYAQMCEEINVENLVDRLKSQEHGNDTNDMYIISGIKGSSKEDKTDKLIQYLGEDNENGEFKNRLKTFSVHILDDDPFNDEDFNIFCPDYPEKRIFWISLECEINATKFVLQGIYNPEFYLKRKFKNVIIKKDLKQQLIKDDLAEIFIFHCAEGKKKLYKFMELNAREMEQIENSCMIKIFSLMKDAEDDFKKRSKQNITVHLIEFEEKQFIWRDSHGSLSNLLNHIDKEEVKLIEEDNFIRKIKDRKVVIFADDPGMGKTTTQIKLYETEIESSSIVKSHWVIGIKLRDHLDAVRVLEFKKDAIDIASLVKFLLKIDSKLNNNLATNLLKIDSKLNNNLATNLLKIVLDKSKSFQAKPLLLIFHGFDEVLDEVYRKQILLLLQFIKDKTAAKLWITTRCHFKKLLEETLSTIAIQFSPMDDAENKQYIATYLQHRLYLTLNKEKYTELFDTDDKKQKLQMYTAAFINKMKSIFRGDISTFIGTPLQLYLMLEITVKDFKNWIEGGDDQISVFKHVRNDVWGVYDYFIEKKYDVYFLKIGIRERDRQRQEKFNIERYHKSFAQSKILEENSKKSLDEFKDIYLLAGVIKSQGTDPEFIHKTFEEFFAAKAFIDWIKEVPSTKNQERLLSEIFMKPDYRLIRIFMNLQLQKMTVHGREVKAVNELDKNLDHYGNVAADLLNKANSLLLNEDRQTPLYIAVQEGNKDIVYFLLNILKRQPDVLKKILFNPKPYSNTPLHLACMREDVQIVKAVLHAAARISKDTLQECIANTFQTAKMCNKNVAICKELLSRANDKLKIIQETDLYTASLNERENFVELLVQEFKCEKHILKNLLLFNDAMRGNALGCARSITIVEKLISAAKLMKDNNETLKKMLLPDVGKLPFQIIVRAAEFDVVEKVLDVAKEIDEDTLKQLLLNDRYVPAISALHVAAKRGRLDVIKLLLETGAELGIEILEKLITAVDEESKNAIQLMFEHGHETIFDDFFKILKEDKYQNIREKVIEMFDNVPLESRLHWDKETLITAIEHDNIKRIKDILSKVKNFSINQNESRRLLLLSDKYFENTLYIACERGNDEIIKELLCYAKETDDDNHTLQQLLLRGRDGESALHVAARSGRGNSEIIKEIISYANKIDDDNHTLKRLLLRKTLKKSALHIAATQGHVDIIKLLVETAADLGIEMLEKLITAVDEEKKNAIQLMIDHGHEIFFDDFFKILKEDKYSNIREKVENMQLESRLYLDKTNLIMAIERENIKEIKDILSKAKTSSVNGNEILRLLLLDDKYFENTLHFACKQGNDEIIKEQLCYAKETDDDNHTLQQLLLRGRYGESALHVAAKTGHLGIIKLLLETGAELGIEMVEKLITDVDEEKKNAIQLMIDHGHEIFFDDFFKILKEDKYSNIREKIENMLLESRLYLDKKNLIMAIEHDNIGESKNILSKVKTSSVNGNESLRILLLDNKYFKKNILHVACKRGNSEIIGDLISYAKEMDDDNHTLKQLLLLKRNGKSALHVATIKGHVDITKLLLETASALDIDSDNHTLKQLLSNEVYGDSALRLAARCGHFDITKLMLETASGLGIDILEKLIFGVDELGQNAIELMAEHGHETIFAESFKMIKDEYPIFWEKAMEMYDNIQFVRTLYSSKQNLIMAIERDDIEKVKDILNKAKDSSVNPNESLRFLLLSKNKWENSTLHTACQEGNTEIMKELLSYTKEIDDDTLKQLLLQERYGSTPLHVAAEHGKVHIINLLLETASNLDIEILEKLITAVDEEGKKAIELMFQYCHGYIFVDSFKMLQEDKYENIRQKVKEMYDNVPLENRLYWDRNKLIMAIEYGDIEKVIHILSNAKNSSANPNESLRFLLLSINECENSTLYIACKERNTEIMKELLSCAKEIDNDNRTLKQLLSNEGYGDSALHVAAKKGHVNVTKLLLETASGLGIDILEEIIFHVNKKGKNAIQLIAEHGPETIFAESFKMLKDEFPIIWAKVKEMYDNLPFERTLYLNKKKLIMAIKHDDTKKVKDILNTVKNSSVDPNESLRFLLLSQNKWGESTLYTACENRNTEIMKELLSYAMNMDDGGSTFKKLLTKPTDMSPLTPLKELIDGYASEIKQILDSLIVEARNNNRDHAVNILEQINNQYSNAKSSLEELDDVLEETIFEDCLHPTSFYSSASSSEDSDYNT